MVIINHSPSLMLTFLAATLVAATHSFGNLDVNWMADGTTGSTQPHVAADKTIKDWKPTREVRKRNLEGLSIDTLTNIVTEMGSSCETCASTPHWTSKVRHTVLELTNKQLKSQLTKRGVKCEKCNQREQYIDLLLDSVHLKFVT